MNTNYEINNKGYEIIKESKELALDFFIERKDEKYIRQKCDISYDQCIEILNSSKVYWFFVKRGPTQNPYGHWVEQKDGTFKKYETYYEVGGYTCYGPKDYFLFIFLSEEDGDSIVTKFKLKPI